jgi:hypothetical protein
MKRKNELKKYMTFIFIIIALILIYGIYTLINNNKNIYIDPSKEIVYVSYESSNYEQKVPSLNIKKVSDDINKEITSFTTPYLEQKDVLIEYHYTVNGNILSLVIIITKSSIEGPPDIAFKTYNINLDKLTVLSNQKVLELCDIKQEHVIKGINNIFNNYYKDELKQKIIPSNMTFEQYLEKRGLKDIPNNIEYYIENGNLNVYLDYNIYIEEETDFYLEDVGYSFIIK